MKKEDTLKGSITKTEVVEPSTTSTIVIKPLNTKIFTIDVCAITGSSLISHRLDGDVVEAFMKREIGEAKVRQVRSYEKEYESCFYYTLDKKYGIPAASFMNAMLDAAVACNIPKTQIKRAIRVLGDVLELKYKKINHRVDYPRRSGRNSAPDTRHRPEFIDWSCTLMIQYDESQISPDQIINLVNQAGFSSGVGDWRPSSPSSSGTHGMFKVVSKKETPK